MQKPSTQLIGFIRAKIKEYFYLELKSNKIVGALELKAPKELLIM